MNRELKFRAWYKPDFETKDGPLKFILSKESDGSLFFKMEKDPDIKYPFNIPFEDDDWIIEQYIGIKDKNGIEIYEGDIISCFNNEERLVIQWAEEYAAFVGEIYLEFDGENWREPGYSTHHYMDDIIGINTCTKVVGNIFENPELLNEDVES